MPVFDINIPETKNQEKINNVKNNYLTVEKFAAYPSSPLQAQVNSTDFPVNHFFQVSGGKIYFALPRGGND